MQTVIKCIEFAFDKYSVNGDLLASELYDFHWENVIIDKDENIYFIDNEMVANKPVDKKAAIKYFTDHMGDEYLRQKVVEYYHLESTLSKKLLQAENLSQYFVGNILPSVWLDELHEQSTYF